VTLIMPTNLIQRIEWSSRDAKRLQKFFSKVFDWEFKKPMPGYTIMPSIGGIFDISKLPEMPSGITSYVNVANLEKTEKAIIKAGGKIYKSNQDVAGMGRFSIFADVDGNTMAIWEATAMPAKKPAPKKKKPSKR